MRWGEGRGEGVAGQVKGSLSVGKTRTEWGCVGSDWGPKGRGGFNQTSRFDMSFCGVWWAAYNQTGFVAFDHWYCCVNICTGSISRP